MLVVQLDIPWEQQGGRWHRQTTPSCHFQVLVTYNGQECAGLVEQHNPLSDKVKVLLPEQGLQACWRVQDVQLAALQPPALPAAGSPSPAEVLQRSVSSNIDVPKRFVPLPDGILLGRERGSWQLR